MTHVPLNLTEERVRVSQGLPPTMPPHIQADDIALFYKGDVEAALSVACGLHDFQRWPLALHMVRNLALPSEAVEQVFSLAITQTHFFRTAGTADIRDVLRYVDQTIPEHIPARVMVYRGGHAAGISWTLSKPVAEFFAERKQCTVLSKKVSKSDIAFFTNDREEQEVILWSAIE